MDNSFLGTACGASRAANLLDAAIERQRLRSPKPFWRGEPTCHLAAKELPLGEILHRAEEPVTQLYFPSSGVVSLVVGLANGQFVEAGMFGRNSVIGGSAALDGPTALTQAIGQVGGSGVAAGVDAVKRIVAESETFRIAMVQHQETVLTQAQQVAACNAVHELEERLSRWLLQVRDLIRSDELPLTQEFLAQMLGVQRSSVTLTARKLQEAGLIDYRRGRIRIRDVTGLHESSCECYAAINAHFLRLVYWAPDLPEARVP
jgi:CRP-like cAMP-binding protein